jgi:hypothetical protein
MTGFKQGFPAADRETRALSAKTKIRQFPLIDSLFTTAILLQQCERIQLPGDFFVLVVDFSDSQGLFQPVRFICRVICLDYEI